MAREQSETTQESASEEGSTEGKERTGSPASPAEALRLIFPVTYFYPQVPATGEEGAAEAVESAAVGKPPAAVGSTSTDATPQAKLAQTAAALSPPLPITLKYGRQAIGRQFEPGPRGNSVVDGSGALGPGPLESEGVSGPVTGPGQPAANNLEAPEAPLASGGESSSGPALSPNPTAAGSAQADSPPANDPPFTTPSFPALADPLQDPHRARSEAPTTQPEAANTVIAPGVVDGNLGESNPRETMPAPAPIATKSPAQTNARHDSGDAAPTPPKLEVMAAQTASQQQEAPADSGSDAQAGGRTKEGFERERNSSLGNDTRPATHAYRHGDGDTPLVGAASLSGPAHSDGAHAQNAAAHSAPVAGLEHTARDFKPHARGPEPAPVAATATPAPAEAPAYAPAPRAISLAIAGPQGQDVRAVVQASAQGLQVSLRATNESTQNALSQHAPELRQRLEEVQRATAGDVWDGLRPAGVAPMPANSAETGSQGQTGQRDSQPQPDEGGQRNGQRGYQQRQRERDQAPREEEFAFHFEGGSKS